MPTVCEVDAIISGDVGGRGISRFRFVNAAGSVPSASDCNTAGAAVRQLYFAMASYIPSDITVAVQGLVNCYDEVSGLVVGPVSMTTVPGAVAGSGAGNYAAGMGMRINWKTNVISGRRLIKGATFMIPLASSAFQANGAPATAASNSLQAAATAYIAALNGVTVQAVVWHRPPKGTHAGGATGPLQAATISGMASGLRSRRS